VSVLPLVPPFRDQGAAGWRIGCIEDLPQFAVDAARTQNRDTQTFWYLVLEFVTQLAACRRQVRVLAEQPGWVLVTQPGMSAVSAPRSA
jgi:hypothetical protein